jgi:selenocysteine lyase/cysteine desulfurase
MIQLSALFDPADFHIEPGVVHLCAAGESAFLRRHTQALGEFARDKSDGVNGRARQEDRLVAARRLAADFLRVPTEDVGLVSSVAEGVSLVASSIDWRTGDNVSVLGNEFPSVTLPFSMRRFPPVELRTASTFEGLLECVDGRTRAIAISDVSYWSSERYDLALLRQAADRVGAILIVDFTHSAGVLEVDPTVADFGFSACYKWLLGASGVAIAYWNRQRQPEWHPDSGGWNSLWLSQNPDAAEPGILKRDAALFTRGNPSFPSVYVLACALAYLAEHGIRRIEAHSQQLVQQFVDGADERGLPLLTPRDVRRRGASVSIRMNEPGHIHGEQEIATTNPGLVHRLQARSIFVWGGQGRLRLSFHGYNTSSDVERLLSALDEEWRG